MNTPDQFVLWLNGAADIIGDSPTPEQWAMIKERMVQALGGMAASKLLSPHVPFNVRREISGFSPNDALQYAAASNTYAEKLIGATNTATDVA